MASSASSSACPSLRAAAQYHQNLVQEAAKLYLAVAVALLFLILHLSQQFLYLRAEF